MSHPQTFTREVPKRRLAREAALCDSYSRKQKPRFFFLSSGELYIITSVSPAEILQKQRYHQYNATNQQ